MKDCPFFLSLAITLHNLLEFKPIPGKGLKLCEIGMPHKIMKIHETFNYRKMKKFSVLCTQVSGSRFIFSVFLADTLSVGSFRYTIASDDALGLFASSLNQRQEG